MVSILVPVYNAAPYLRECVGSLIGQTYTDLQIVMINDGSKDESWEVLQELACGIVAVSELLEFVCLHDVFGEDDRLLVKLEGGLYSYSPLGVRVLHKVEQIVREEMDRAGACEVLFTALQPIELWEESGRAGNVERRIWGVAYADGNQLRFLRWVEEP